ncbi:MAG: hypothetical protein SF187_13705 [Deltaproteobacteria bacterium]|nr:hypothetical protein [Deltaproteobacteria bacterium]
MKVNGTGSGLPPVDAEAADAATKAEPSQNASETQGASAAETNLQASPVSPNTQTRAPEMATLVADVNADFQAGRITAEAAVDKIVQRVLDRQVGASASPALRAQVESALRQTLANDPFVGAQVSALQRKQG